MKPSLQIVILDDEPKMGKILSRILEREGHQAASFTDPLEALEAMKAQPPDLLLTDLKMPGMSGLDVMRKAREFVPDLDAIMMTAYATVETAIRAMKDGALDYLIKPFPNEELVMVVARTAETRGLREENKLLKQTIQTEFKPEGIVAVSPGMRDLLRRVAKVGASDVTVLLRGESGTGKEVLATAIHAASDRRDRPLVKVNCGALTETLLESELFGHVRGAFTGAIETRKGVFQQADGGTIFLDEIGEVSQALQVKLLRVLQTGDVQRVGDAQTFKVDVRVIAATNRHLEEMIQQGAFRSDLYYRLNVVPLVLPALRERTEDIPALIDAILARIRRRSGKKFTVTPEAFAILQTYRWPGNIRELENALEHAAVMCEEQSIAVPDLPVAVQNAGTAPGGAPSPGAVPGVAPGATTLEEMEQQALMQALEATGFNHTQAARRLGITRRTLGYRIAKYNIPRRDPALRTNAGEEARS
jgi:DNA-binding NtrC family response regulator